VTNIINALNAGRVTFSYKKNDGSTRKAVGTLNESMIPEADRPSSPTVNTGEQVNYYDLERNAWRQFKQTALDTASIKSEASA
jgi:hypothetical protein